MIDWAWLECSEKWLYEFNLQLTVVLVEYDGPHLALFKDESGRQYFGIFSDFIDRLHRWMLAPVSGAESIALASGAVPLLDVFRKQTIWFCDLDGEGKSVQVWHASFEQIPEALLPVRGHLLPEFARRPMSDFMKVDTETAVIKLDGRRVVNNSMPFRELGQFLLQFQDYWERLSRSSILKLLGDGYLADPRTFASLSFLAASEGSVNIHFKPTADLEQNRVLYKSTLDKLAQVDEKLPSSLAKELGPVGVRNANKMYSLMHSAGIDMLLVTPEKSLFIGSEKAGRLAIAIRKTQKVKSNNLILRGHFCAGRSKKAIHTFEFVDEATGHNYKGKVSPLVWRYTSISVGDSDYFEVEIESYERTKDNQPFEMGYTLIRAERMRRPQLLDGISET